ncbi:MAG: ATP-binding cassette domain-containing protein [Verrucomicrobia bacterium]|nr:ATP-binding cassette domain-containing protein [Verrucomicrobiota bacterium]
MMHKLLSIQPMLRVTGANHRYGAIDALRDVSLEVYPGEVFGIVGESGSGKSTLLRMLNLQEVPDQGKYTIDYPDIPGCDLFSLDRLERQEIRTRHIGIVYQNPHLGLRMHNTSSGNIASRLLIAGERSFGKLRDAARTSLSASDFPLDRMDELPARLSGGMQQRVQLAKAIALRPCLLLLDEPTSGLDLSVQARVLDTLKKLQRETRMTMVLVSHDLGVIRTLADRVMVMKKGEVIESGLTDQILQDPQDPYTQELVYAKL